ncbi:neuroligin-4, X-linked-like [Tubulanus polymorphus]|uniref:neuroligin-4, X-linked-like n=1 Tax=Tubulanus polymorphus TaxID=672921 RepID=UPI003DA292C0
MTIVFIYTVDDDDCCRNSADGGAGSTDKLTQTIDVFQGVPYAEPPLNELRFMNPVPKSSWAPGIWNASHYGYRCPSLSYPGRENDSLSDDRNEDCLYLNIYTPYERSHPNAKYPVILYVHGGSFLFDSGAEFDGHVLPQFGVVLVTFNYRLGVLGFLTTGDERLPGQYGLLDQIFVMQWVQKYISKFRGDPTSVTLIGNSCGGVSVGIHLLSAKTKGLFHRVIIMSGPPNSYFGIHAPDVDFKLFMDNVTGTVNCTRASISDSVNCLRKIPWPEFVHHTHNTYPRISPTGVNLKPYVDNNILTGFPLDLIRTNQYRRLPIIIGTVKHEWVRNMGGFFSEMGYDHIDLCKGLSRDLFLKILRKIFKERFGFSSYIREQIMFEYTDWSNIDDPFINRDNYVQLMTDLAMLAPSVQLSKELTETGSEVFFYIFHHVQKIQTANELRERCKSDGNYWRYNYTYHESDLNYLFGAPFSKRRIYHTWIDEEFTKEDLIVSELAMTLWTNFAKYG